MTLSLRTNILSNRIGTIVKENSNALTQTSARLSSGSRINFTGEDSADIGKSQALSATNQERGKNISNAGLAAAVLTRAGEATSALVEVTSKIYELAVVGTGYLVTTAQRSAISQELGALTQEFDRITQSATYNQHSLLKGNFVPGNVQLSEQGNNQTNLTLTLGQYSENYLGTLSVSTVAAAESAKSISFQAYSTVADKSFGLDAQGNRLAIALDQLTAQKANTELALGRILDIDAAEEGAMQLGYKILIERGIALQAQANLDPQRVTQLLQ